MTDVIFLNDKEALLHLCGRNALKYAMGEVKLTLDLQAQMEYLYENSSKEKRELYDTIFQIRHDIDKGLLD